MLRRSFGFTLVELLVVMAIIGFLVALLLPAVQAARESGRRTVCKNNLRQIGLALHSYHDVHHRLPSGWLGYINGLPDPEGPPGWGWAVPILPYIEQSGLAAKVDWNVSLLDPRHAEVRVAELPVFQCPSDLVADPTWDLDAEGGGPPTTLARANYVACFGTTEFEEHEDEHEHEEHAANQPHHSGHSHAGEVLHGDGMFFHNSKVTFGQVTDGLSFTLMVGERSSKFGFSTWVGVAAGGEEAFPRILGIADHPPNHPTAHFDDFGSMHPQGAHFAMGDASVRLIPATIGLQVYQGLSTRAGGERVGLSY
jgi:prepilin-type N-terminal cleavage/methylation domain-containing protein